VIGIVTETEIEVMIEMVTVIEIVLIELIDQLVSGDEVRSHLLTHDD
jgi:hypothetical protein